MAAVKPVAPTAAAVGGATPLEGAGAAKTDPSVASQAARASRKALGAAERGGGRNNRSSRRLRLLRRARHGL
eukprot:1233510-Lingulodinium_polyedra.AAC.1